MTPTTPPDLPRTVLAPRLRRRFAARGRRLAVQLLTVLAAASLLGQAALAQTTPTSFSRILPETTIFAFFAQPAPGATDLFEELAAELDLEGARETMRKLGVVLGSVADDALDLGFDLSEPGGYDEMLGDLADTCPALADALREVEPEELAGRAALGVSVSAYAPLPAVLAIVRTDDAQLGSDVFEALTGCFDSGVALSEGDVPFYILGDGGDFPVIVAQVDGTILLASDPEALRGMVRRAAGANEPSLAGTRVGGLARGLTNRGVAFTLNLAGLADVLGSFAPMIGGAPEQMRLVERVLDTLRVVDGVAFSATLDEGGLVFDSVISVDSEVAEASGELELLALLDCSGCTAAAPTLIPAGPASLSRSSFSAEAFVAWLDSWLADLEPVLGDLLPAEVAGERFSVAGLVEQFFGVEVSFDWLGDTTYLAQLGVYDTDLASWIQGPGLVSITPVASESRAREATSQWREALLDPAGPLAALLRDSAEGGEVLESMTLDSMISFRSSTYRGVTYERMRSPFAGDYGYAVFGGHLVVTQPARTMQDVIDVHLGSPSVADDSLFGHLLNSQPAVPASYQLVDLPRYLSGLAALADLAAGPIASVAYVATSAAVSETVFDDDDGSEPIDPADVPTFDDLVRLTDLATKALNLLADRTGVAIGSSEIIDGVHWSTLRVPLR